MCLDYRPALGSRVHGAPPPLSQISLVVLPKPSPLKTLADLSPRSPYGIYNCSLPKYRQTTNAEQITDAILREAQRKLDLIKKRGATGVGWTRPSPPASGQTAAAPSPAVSNHPPLHLLHEPAYSDDPTAMSSPTKERDRRRRRHEDVHGSDAPPVQAALRGGGGGGAKTATGADDSGGGRRLVWAKDGRHAATAADSSPATVAAEGLFGREDRRRAGSGSSAGHSGSVDMTALSGLGGGGGGGAEPVAVRKVEEGNGDEDWAPSPSPLIFGSHSIDAAESDGQGVAGSGATGTRVVRSGGGDGEYTASFDPVTPVSPSKGPPSFTGALSPTPRQEEHVYDSDEDAAMPPVMVPLHRVAQANTTSTASASVDSTDAAGGGKDAKTASGLAGGAKNSTPQKKKLGGKEEYAMLFSNGNE